MRYINNNFFYYTKSKFDFKNKIAIEKKLLIFKKCNDNNNV